MKVISNILFLYCFFGLLYISNENIINNPRKSSAQIPNPVKYMMIFQSWNVSIQVEQNVEKIYQESYIFSDSFFIVKGQSNNNYLLLQDKLYSINNGVISFLRTLPNNIIYIRYIKEKSNRDYNSQINYFDNITFYGMNKNENNHFCFYYFGLEGPVCADLGITDTNISCKPLEYRLYICTYIKNGKVALIMLKFNIDNTNKKIEEVYYRNITNLTLYKNAVIYDTSSSSDYKIICGSQRNTRI